MSISPPNGLWTTLKRSVSTGFRNPTASSPPCGTLRRAFRIAGYYVSRRADLAFYAPSALQKIGAAELAAIATEANALFAPDGPSPDHKVRAEQLRQLGEPVRCQFTALDDRYFDTEEDVDELLETWFLNHPNSLSAG